MSGRRRAGSKARVVSDERAVRFLGIGAGLEIARGRVVGLHGLAGDPRQTRVRRYRGVGLVQIGIDQRIAGEAEYRGAIGEEIDILRANDMHELERGLSLWPWLTDEVADAALAVDVALSVAGATAVDVAVVEAAGLAATVLDAVEEGVELAVSARPIAGSASVDVALVDVAVRAATMPVFKVPTMMRLVRRTLATENATRLFFIPS